MTPARPRNAPRGDADAERWLVPCAEAAVLEVVEQTWQFAHDKLRERLLEDVDSAARRGLHAQVARGIVASRTELAPFSAPLAYHYREDAEPAHAAHYDLLAGEQALKEGALQTTVIHLRQALDYYDTHGGELLLRVRRRRQLSEACYALGQVDDCIAHFKPGRALLGRPYPEAGPRRWLRTAAEAGVQAVHALVPWLAPKSRLGRAQLQELIALNHAAEEAFIWHGQDSGALLCSIEALNAAEATGEVDENLIMGYSFIGYLMCILGQERVARFYLEQGAARMKEYRNPLAQHAV